MVDWCWCEALPGERVRAQRGERAGRQHDQRGGGHAGVRGAERREFARNVHAQIVQVRRRGDVHARARQCCPREGAKI